MNQDSLAKGPGSTHDVRSSRTIRHVYGTWLGSPRDLTFTVSWRNKIATNCFSRHYCCFLVCFFCFWIKK